MEGKELLKHFRKLPEHQQNKILVDAYKQISTLHHCNKSFDSFTWRDCRLENDELTITAGIDNNFNQDSLQRNLKDYAGVLYCLATGRSSTESMSWDAGQKIDSPVLREIVLTICGRNDSVEPLIRKLNQPYTDEDTFFAGYSTVYEKEATDAYNRRHRIEQKNRKYEETERLNEFLANQPSAAIGRPKPWYTKWWYYLLLFLIVGGVRACKYSQNAGRQQVDDYKTIPYKQDRQMRQNVKNIRLDLRHELNRNTPYKSEDENN